MEAAVENTLLARQGLKILMSELALQNRHLQMVRKQNAALLRSDRKGFTAMHDAHVELVGELAIQNKIRLNFFADRKTADVIQGWPDAEQKAAVRIMDELKAVVTDVVRINEQNGKLVGAQIKFIDFMLNLLVGTYRKGSTYGPHGACSINRANLFFNSAA
jgi:flagellar biosynthesis/type III secretory pathway chaperone